MRRQLTSNYSDICSLVGLQNTSANATVAVLDSAYKPSEAFREANNIGRTVDFVNQPDTDDTTGHARGVLSNLAGVSENLVINLYRVVQKSGVILQRHLLKALGKAHFDDEVDIINLSLGFDHSNDGVSCDMPNEPCKVRDAAKQAIDDGITVVAAAGNNDPGDDFENDTSICCPALLDEVICVGGFLPACTYSSPQSTDTPVVGPANNAYPPLSCWLLEKGEDAEGETICSGLGCTIGEDCDSNRVIVEWSGNPPAKNSKPNILAPVAYPIINTKNEPDITFGTSYATPYVSGILSSMIAIMKEAGVEWSPQELKNIIEQTAEPVEEGEGSYICATPAMSELKYQKDLPGSFKPANSVDVDFD